MVGSQYPWLLLVTIVTIICSIIQFEHIYNNLFFSNRWENHPLGPPPPLSWNNSINMYAEDVHVIAFDYWNHNGEAKGHVYPYLASCITFSCLFTCTVLLICLGPNLG